MTLNAIDEKTADGLNLELMPAVWGNYNRRIEAYENHRERVIGGILVFAGFITAANSAASADLLLHHILAVTIIAVGLFGILFTLVNQQERIHNQAKARAVKELMLEKFDHRGIEAAVAKAHESTTDFGRVPDYLWPVLPLFLVAAGIVFVVS